MKPEETIDYHLRKLWHGISRAYNIEASKFNLTMSAGFALLSIEKTGTPSTQLGPRMGMEARSLTRLLKKMEENNWIEKRADKKDKRIVRIFLTEKGKKKRKIARTAVLKFNNKINNNISASDLDTFFKVSQQVEDILEHNNIFNNE